MEPQPPLPTSVHLIMGFLVVSCVSWIVGQGGALIDYDTAAEWGLQVDSRKDADPVVIEVSRGIAVADVYVQLPLFILAILGLKQREFYGAVLTWMALGMNFYWTTVAWAKLYFFQQAGVRCQPIPIGLNCTLVFIDFFSFWASWYLYNNKDFLFILLQKPKFRDE